MIGGTKMPIPLLEFITGPAGTGKTFTLKQRIQEAKDQALACKDGRARSRPYGVLTAITGIAALNLSGGTGDAVATLNSTLKYFDTASLKDNFASRRLHSALKDVFKLGRNLIIDEISMMDAIQLDLIYDALEEINEQAEVQNRGGLGLVLAGDFCLGKDTFVMMYKGGNKRVQDIQIGDKVMGPDWKPRNVTNICKGYGNLFHVYQSAGVNYLVNENHTLVFKTKYRLNEIDYASNQNTYIRAYTCYQLKHNSVMKSFRGFKLSKSKAPIESQVSVDFSHEGEYFGFETDKDHLFLLGDGTVTHNCQLPPVKAEFAFTAKCWNKFKHTKLTKIWRQDNLQYIQMLNAARGGDGKLASEMIMDMKEITINDRLDSHFEGTTIVPVNKLVDSINKVRLDELLSQKNRMFDFRSFRWGRQNQDWKNIPESRIVCQNAYVMILANDSPQFTYANGSCGIVADANIDSGTCHVKLSSNGKIVPVRKVTRHSFQRETPEGLEKPIVMTYDEWEDSSEADIYPPGIGYKIYLNKQTETHRWLMGNCKPYFHCTEGKWVMGEISFCPIKLAYASTVHRSQGLSLDRIQIDYSHAFFGEPSMSYTSLSRCRTPEGLTIVGNRKLIENRTNIDVSVLPWI